jgi:hypothetical protein
MNLALYPVCTRLKIDVAYAAAFLEASTTVCAELLCAAVPAWSLPERSLAFPFLLLTRL